MNSWLSPLVSHVIDINPPMNPNNGPVVIQGDINEYQTWKDIDDNFFDFVSCTHTLEDIRDPKFVAEQMSRVGKAGFVSVPNRHQELSNIESRYYLGYCHHRWIFRVLEGNLTALAKFAPYSLGLSQKDRTFSNLLKMRSIFPGERFKGRRFWKPHLDRKFFKKMLAHKDITRVELGLIWKDQLEFKYVNDDFPGFGYFDLMRIGNEFVGLDISESNQEYTSLLAMNIALSR